jgi:hypothetical protein
LSNQSRKLLCTVLMKNWDPPELGAPVLAIEKVLQFELAAVRGKETRTEVRGEVKRKVSKKRNNRHMKRVEVEKNEGLHEWKKE